MMQGGGKEVVSVSFVRQAEDALAALYLDVLRESDVATAKTLLQKNALLAQGDERERRRGYIALWESLNEEQQLAVAAHDAKINHLRRMARIMATTEVVRAHNEAGADTADSIDFVIRRFAEENVASGQVQKFIDENAVAWFSLTGHPTNPTTVDYTRTQTAAALVLSRVSSTQDDLKEVLRDIIMAPVVGERKTPLEEAEETLNTLHVIFDAALEHKNLFEAALVRHGYAEQGVKIYRPLIRPCVWTLGDGDGNDSMTAQVLIDGIALHRAHIRRRYHGLCQGFPERIKQGLMLLIAGTDANALAEAAEEEGQHDFAYLVRCFGLGFGTVDLRHNARDIMVSVQRLLDAGKIMTAAAFEAFSLEQQAASLAVLLEDGNVVRRLSNIAPEMLAQDDKNEEGKTAARILGRLAVIGKNPDMCEKLIIAETTHPAHALAALLLLKASGNAVGTAESRIDLTVLSESVHDLVCLGNALEDLLENKTFRAHVASRGQLLAMIAKSDTTRQDGRGEAEYAQYEASVDVYHAVDKMKRKYPELEKVLVSVKNGGGHALQRGGGRVTEIAAIHGRAAADARTTDTGPSTLTVQGQQQTILFCPGKTARGTLEALAAQNLYTKAGVQGEMPVPVFSKTMNKQYARADARLYAMTAGAAFDHHVRHSSAIDALLVNAPWLAMKAGNVSSRPAKRGEKPLGAGVTPREAKGKNPKALAGRAISGERLTAHACLPVFSVLGLVEAMEAIRHSGQARMNPKKYGDALHHLYRAHKIYRDAARATLNAVAMADFDIAWPLLTGKERPAVKTVRRLAEEYRQALAGKGQSSPAATMAFMEEYFLQAEMLTYEMASGQPAKKPFEHGDGLRRLWPELAAQVDYRNANAEFARVIECHRTRLFDAAPDVPLTLAAFRITQALYAAATVVNAPVGILATRTRLEPVYEVGRSGKTRFMRPESFDDGKRLHLLERFPALGSLARAASS